MMVTMHETHGINQRSDTSALNKLSKIAVGITELPWMLYDPNTPGDTAVRMFDVIHKLGADAAAFNPEDHGSGCWVCAELRRIGEGDLLIPADEQRKANRIPSKNKEKTKASLIGRRSRAVILKPRTRRKERTCTDDDSHTERAIQRTPETILEARLHDAQEKGHFRCDSCTPWFRGPFKGEFFPGIREMAFEDLMDGWQNGTVDASWHCVDCWDDYVLPQ